MGGEFGDDRLDGDVGNTEVHHPLGFADLGLEGDQHDHLVRGDDLGKLGVGLDSPEAGPQVDDGRPGFAEVSENMDNNSLDDR